jgi:hypothetical protein
MTEEMSFSKQLVIRAYGDRRFLSSCPAQPQAGQPPLADRPDELPNGYIPLRIQESRQDKVCGYDTNKGHTEAFQVTCMIMSCLSWISGVSIAMTALMHPMPSSAASEADQTSAQEKAVLTGVIRAPDWIGAVNITDGGCNASMGEYTLWVYATAKQCGVPRPEADRVAIIRQPLPGISPIRSSTQLPGGRYAVWVYGAGDTDHLQIRVCAKTCIIGDLPAKPSWVFLDWIELRDRQTILLRSWQQPEAHLLYVQAISLSSSNISPDWIP